MFRVRVVVAVFAAFAAALVAATADLFLLPDEDHPTHADVVVVLAGEKEARLEKALELMRRGVAPVLAISDGRDPGWPEANALCAEHASFRVICFDAHPFDTHGEAEAVARIGRRLGWHSVVVVTSTYHVTRARLLFERCFRGRVQTVGSGNPVATLPGLVASEWAKLVYALTVAREC